MANSSMERIVPDELHDEFGLASLHLHYERYRFAGKYIVPGRVLDIACGTGYGSYLLVSEFGDSISEIIGVDISAESISYAHERYTHSKIRFIGKDVFDFVDEKKFDTIITLETIEHLRNPSMFIEKLYQLLLPGGILIASAPVTFSTDINPYHLNDFSQKSFRQLFSSYSLVENDSLLQIQPISMKNIVDKKKSSRSEGIRRNMTAYYFSHPKAFYKRSLSIIKDGLCNKYLVLALKRRD